MKLHVKKVHGVATWTWNASDDSCGICRYPFDGCCPTCKIPGDNCPLVWGECNHSFHMHCIIKWISGNISHQQCPMCRQEWKFKEAAAATEEANSTEDTQVQDDDQ